MRRRRQRDDVVTDDDATEIIDSSLRRRSCSRWPRSRPRGRRTSRPSGAASRRGAERVDRGARRVDATGRSVANRQAQIDVALFTQWIDAYAQDEAELTSFYRKRFRDEFEPAFEAWIATKPRQNPKAPLSPFAMPQYRLAASTEAERLEEAGGEFSAHDVSA